jgi:hypothetical protein
MLQTRTGDPLLARSRPEVLRDLHIISQPPERDRSLPFSFAAILSSDSSQFSFDFPFGPDLADDCPNTTLGYAFCHRAKDRGLRSKNTVEFQPLIDYIAMT